MPHLPENNPLNQLERELSSIQFLAMHNESESIDFRLVYARQHLARLADEQDKIKREWKRKHQWANLLHLKVVHWRERYEWSEKERERLLDLVNALDMTNTTLRHQLEDERRRHA